MEIVEQVGAVDDGDHAVDARHVVQAVAVLILEVEGGGHGHRLAHARRLDQ